MVTETGKNLFYPNYFTQNFLPKPKIRIHFGIISTLPKLFWNFFFYPNYFTQTQNQKKEAKNPFFTMSLKKKKKSKIYIHNVLGFNTYIVYKNYIIYFIEIFI